MEKQMNLSVPTCSEYSDTELAVYLGLQEYVRHTFEMPALFSAKILCYYIYKKIDTYKVRSVQDVINKFDFIEKIGTDCYSCGIKSFTSERFTLIKENEYRTIINSGKKNSEALLSHFIHIVKSFDYRLEILGQNGIVGHMSYEYFSKTYNKNTNTIGIYNKDLVDLGLIYMRRQTNFKDSIYLPNLYCRAEDSEFLDAYLTKF